MVDFQEIMRRNINEAFDFIHRLGDLVFRWLQVGGDDFMFHSNSVRRLIASGDGSEISLGIRASQT